MTGPPSTLVTNLKKALADENVESIRECLTKYRQMRAGKLAKSHKKVPRQTKTTLDECHQLFYAFERDKLPTGTFLEATAFETEPPDKPWESSSSHSDRDDRRSQLTRLKRNRDGDNRSEPLCSSESDEPQDDEAASTDANEEQRRAFLRETLDLGLDSLRSDLANLRLTPLQRYEMGLTPNPPDDDTIPWPFPNCIFPEPPRCPSSTFKWNAKENAWIGKTGSWQRKKAPLFPGYQFHMEYVTSDGVAGPAYVRSWFQTKADIDAADPSRVGPTSTPATTDDTPGVATFEFGRRYKDVATMKATKMSLTITIPNTDVPRHFLEEINAFLKTYCNKGVASLERGEKKNNSTSNVVMRFIVVQISTLVLPNASEATSQQEQRLQ